MTKTTRFIELAVAVALSLTLLGCILCRPAKCDDIDDARKRLKAIETEKEQAEVIASAKAAQAIADQVTNVAEDISTEIPEAEEPPQPVPDPISKQPAPTMTFATAVGDSSAKPRLPRAVIVCGQHCSPCEKMKRENSDIIGGPDMPIQLVQNWLANDLDALGITPGMQLGTPYVFVIGKDGTVHGLTPTGLTCVLRGYRSRDELLSYLQDKEHGIDITVPDKSPVIATVTNAELCPDTLAAVLGVHLMREAGADVEQLAHDAPPDSQIMGGLFDFSFDVPDAWREAAAKLVTLQRYEFPSAGITVDWSGPTRSFMVSETGIKISPGVKVTLNKWLVKYSATLDGLSYTPDLSTVTLLLTGAPDLTVHLK